MKENALDDLEWLLEAYEAAENERSERVFYAESAAAVAEESEASALRDRDAAEKRAEAAEAEAKRLLLLLSPPVAS